MAHLFDPVKFAQRATDKTTVAANMSNIKTNANAMGTPRIKAALETLAASVEVILSRA